MPSLSLVCHSPFFFFFPLLLPSVEQLLLLAYLNIVWIRNYFSIFNSFFSLLSAFSTFLHSHILPFLSFFPSFYPFPPLFLPSFIPLCCRPPLSRSVRYCLKSWAAVWWLKRWQIDTFTHDRTLADRAQGERGRDEEREGKWGRRAKKITSWQQRDPYFHKLKWMDRSGWVCVSLVLHPALFALFFSLFRVQVMRKFHHFKWHV